MRQIKVGFVSLGTAFVLWACSAPPPAPAPASTAKLTDGKDGKAGKTPAGAATPAGPGAGPATTTNPTDPAPGSAQGEEKEDACFAACTAKFPTGAKQAEEADNKWSACACAASACGAQCGQTEMCKEDGVEMKDGDACSTCLEGAAAQKCDAQGEATCTGECASYQSCSEACEGGTDGGEKDDDDK